MSATNAKRKRQAPNQMQITTAQSNILYSLLDCYEFLAPNEYSERTIGIQAFLTRKSVGDINFSDIIDDSEKRNRQGQTTNFAAILEEKLANLPIIDASVEKCLMLSRLISFIKENETRFTSIISDIRLDMQLKMADHQTAASSYNFHAREQEFNSRKFAQENRRLFYYSHDEIKQPPNLVYLQNRTTEHLTFIMNQMPRDSKSRQTYLNELDKILRTSFLIVDQPHSGTTPVTIYERKAPGEYTAKISVTIISLLYDFMQTHPNLLELFDIEPSLYPSSTYYKLEEPRSLSWKTCQVQTAPGGKSRTFLYAELSAITIEQASKTDTRVRFAQLLHSFKFAVKVQLNLADSKMPPVFQIPLESVRFGIGAHNNQVPQLLARVILEDIQRISKAQLIDVKTMLTYMRRYFIHRTGVRPNDCVNIFLEQELIKATNQRINFQSVEDVYWDFLVHFVHQVEFMRKHPVLAMFHADGLFLGICNSERAAEAIVQSTIAGSPVIALRLNSIRVDYNVVATSSTGIRPVKLSPCAVRVDIYNDRTKKLQNRTFDTGILAADISKFVLSTHTDSANRIYVLSTFDDRTNGKNVLSFGEFSKYYHNRLQQILKNDEKYKPVTDLIDNANDGNADEDIFDSQSQASSDLFPFSPNSLSSFLPMTPSLTFDNEQSSDANSVHDYTTIPYDSQNNNVASPQHVFSPHNCIQQQPQPQAQPQAQPQLLPQPQPQPQPYPYVNDQEALINIIRTQPNIAEEFMRRCGIYNVVTPTTVSQQIPQQLPMQYQTQPFPYQPPSSIAVLQQRPSLQIPLQQPQNQPLYHQQQPQIYQNQQELRMPFPQPIQQQSAPVRYQDPQRRQGSSVIHYLPNNANLSPSPRLIQPPQQFQFPTTNAPDTLSQTAVNRMNNSLISNGNSNVKATSFVQQQIPPIQTSTMLTAEQLQNMIDELTSNPTATNNN
ncbi:unnamed protein product [Rotaria magnacalcarata]|uniref:Uncharacterized protein n=1 Tax=Rotaria magnacalcarata TaxID=392030 RepID=A0A815VXQ0_9BILA|nr:unnamed protein product [Rotaria magnacalcarata]